MNSKNKLAMLAMTAALALGTQAAFAAEFRDADNFAGTVIPAGLSFSSGFDISAEDLGPDAFTVTAPYTGPQGLGDSYTSALGYVPGDDITDGTVNFWLQDANGDTIEIQVGLSTILSSVNSGGTVFLSQSLNVTLEADLEADGSISYDIQNNGPTAITFDYAVLIANATPAAVPEGGLTLSLLGSALIGLGLLRRKLKA